MREDLSRKDRFGLSLDRRNAGISLPRNASSEPGSMATVPHKLNPSRGTQFFKEQAGNLGQISRLLLVISVALLAQGMGRNHRVGEPIGVPRGVPVRPQVAQ